MLSCKETSLLIIQSEEGTLSLSQKMTVRMHLFLCSACRSFVKQVSSLQQVIAQEEQITPTKVKLSNQGRERIRKALQQRE